MTKYIRYLSLLLLGCLSTFAQPPRTVVSLDSDWRFTEGQVPAASKEQFDDSAWQPVAVPHVFPPSTNGGHRSAYRGEAWYRRAFAAPEEWKGQRVFLRFDAVSLVSDVYLNGERLGEHRGGFAAFTFEITDKIRYSANNRLAVRVDNRLNEEVSPLETSLLYGGIYRHVSLILTGPVDIDLLDYSSPGVFLTQRSVTGKEALVDVRTEVSNGTASASDRIVRVTALNAANEPVASVAAKVEFPANRTATIASTITIPNPHLWNGVADPYLYSVRVDLLDGEKIVDTVTQPLGLRTFHVDASHGFVLNGVARQIHGVCLHQDWGDRGWAIGQKEEQEDLGTLREMGADGLRLVHYQHSQSALDLYDRTGMLVWSELAQFGRVGDSKAYSENVQQQLIEMIRQNYNHPSIVMWSLYNELNSKTKSLSLPIVRNLNAVAHREDKTRPTVAAASGDTIANAHEIVETQDLIGDNNYPGWYFGSPDDMAAQIDKWNAAYGHRGLAISEYGGGAKIADHKQGVVNGEVKPYGPFQPEEWQAAVHEGNYRGIQSRREVWGSFVWLAFDSGGMVREDGTIEDSNIKGLVTQDRKVRKDAYFFYQANWASKPMVYVTSRRQVNRTEASTAVKVYSNASSVKLTVNGRSYGAGKVEDRHIFHWKHVALEPGDNHVEVSTPEGLRDEVTWTLQP